MSKISIFDRIYNAKPVKTYTDWAAKEIEAKGNSAKESLKVLNSGNDEKKIHTNYSRLTKIVPSVLMSWLSLIQCAFFAKSKEIPEDKKYSLIFSEIYTVAIGVVGGLLLNNKIEKLTDKFIKQAENVYANHTASEKEILKNGIKIAVPAAFAVVLFQYVGAVIAVPTATMTTKYLIKKGKINNPNQEQSINIKG